MTQGYPPKLPTNRSHDAVSVGGFVFYMIYDHKVIIIELLRVSRLAAIWFEEASSAFGGETETHDFSNTAKFQTVKWMVGAVNRRSSIL